MKYIKTYEENKSKLKIGNYVICHNLAKYQYYNDRMNDFLYNNVGQYVKYSRDFELKYGVKYDNLPSDLNINLDSGLLWFDRYEIFDYSDNKEELEIKLMAKLYNL